MKVAIIGLSQSTHDLAPYGTEWELWGLPWDPLASRFDVQFEMHDRTLIEMPESLRKPDYVETLGQYHLVYMQQHWHDIPGSVPYPLDAVRETVFKDFPRWDQDDWYNSSPAYMIALAVHMGAEEIGLWGVDVLDESEYQYERPCLEFLIGLAVGRGIKVTLPEGPTALGKFRGKGIKFGTMNPVYNKRYGYV